MKVNEKDKDILRRLGGRIAEIAALPVQAEKRRLWRCSNDLKPVRPVVFISQVPWHEMDVDGSLKLRSRGDFVRDLEWDLRRIIYQWEHMPADMVVEPVIYLDPVIEDTGILDIEEDTVITDDASDVVSHHYKPQITGERDLEKIRMPKVTFKRQETEDLLNTCRDIFDGILRVEMTGVRAFRMAVWDEIVTWTGVETVLMDLAMRREYVHALVERVTEAHLHRLEQHIALGLVPEYNADRTTGDGALGYTDELPKTAQPVTAITEHLWAAAAAQIFAHVSPAMHEEFALQYEKRWLNRFGLSYYGCCEPLHDKVDILRRHVHNLRKISCSPWADVERMAEECGGELVISMKPNPAILAGETFNLESARADLRQKLEKTAGASVEVVMKDISTVRYEPQRLWAWARMAVETAKEFEN